MSQSSIARLVFYVGGTLLAVVVWRTELHMQSTQQVYGEYTETLTGAQQSQLSAFLEMNRLITTLSTTLLGAMGFFLVNDTKGKGSTRELWAAFACAVCVGLSLFYGYHAYQDIIFMLQSQTFNLYGDMISWDRQGHFSMFLLAAFFFVDFAFHELNRSEEPAVK